MIIEKIKTAKQILENYPQTRRDKGSAEFLNKVHYKLFGDKPVDFRYFNTESWTRARRKALEKYPELDERDRITDNAVATVKREVA